MCGFRSRHTASEMSYSMGLAAQRLEIGAAKRLALAGGRPRPIHNPLTPSLR